MATALLFIGWNRPVAGKENGSVEVLHGGRGRRAHQVPETGISSSASNASRSRRTAEHLNGFVLLFGERAKLDELRRTDEFERFSISLGMLFEGYGVVPGLNNEGLQKAMGRMKDL